MRLLALLFLLFATPLTAQQAPPRPELPRGSDPNNWESYYDLGFSNAARLPKRAEAAFYWAARLDPSRAEPLHALWAAFHFRDIGRWERYREEDRRILERPDVMRADSLLHRALHRNPFVHRGLDVLLVDQLPGRWRQDPTTRAWLAYGAADFVNAAERFDRLARRSRRYRFWAVLANVSGQRFDKAAAHLDTLLAEVHREEQQRLVQPDDSKEMYEYALALLHRVRGDTGAARQALERALVANAAFYAARLQLGELALLRGRAADAAEEFRQAAELAPGDGYIHFRLGYALLQARRAEEALIELRRAAELEPYYAEIDLWLGLALDKTGDIANAREVLVRYLDRAPRTAARQRELAQRWLAAHAPAAGTGSSAGPR